MWTHVDVNHWGRHGDQARPQTHEFEAIPGATGTTPGHDPPVFCFNEVTGLEGLAAPHKLSQEKTLQLCEENDSVSDSC